MTTVIRQQGGANLVHANSQHRAADHPPLSEDLFAVLGHEIRNPLSALNFALEAWPATMDEPQLVEDLLQIMRRQVAQLTRLCTDLLDSAKIAEGKLTIGQSPVNVGQAIQNACEQIRPFIAQCGHTMTVALGGLPLTLLGDESKLTQVFANLLHNAAKFTDRHGHLHISLEKDHETAVIRLCDNGCGIRADHLEEIFLPRGSSIGCSERPKSGLGIGLRLAKSIVELHGGVIEASSKGEGQGSTFVVRLPLLIEQPADTTVRPSQHFEVDWKDRSRLPRYRIVVVDDDRSMRFLMSRLLKTLEQSVTVADNGDAALEAILQSQPQVVFLDLQMHGMSGYQVASELRKRTELNGVVLIALSGSTDVASRRLAAQSGFDQYLVKPTSFAELTEALIRVG